MSVRAFFPFLVGLPYSLVPDFRKVDNDTWFEADLRVTSPTTADVIVYDIFDSFSGGRGEHLRTVKLVDIGDKLKKTIDARAKELAWQAVEAEDRAAMAARVEVAKSDILRAARRSARKAAA